MNAFEYKSISPAEFRVYEARAHQLRAQAAHTGVLAVVKYFKNRMHNLATLISNWRHA